MKILWQLIGWAAAWPVLVCAGLTILSVLLGSFGNALEPVSTFTWAHPLLTLMAWHALLAAAPQSPLGVASAAACLALSQATASTVAFLKAFSIAGLNSLSIFVVIMIGLVSWTAVTLLCFVPTHLFSTHFPTSPAKPLVFPVTWTATFFLLGLTPISTFPNPANSLLDYQPLAALAAFFGLDGINFLLALLTSYTFLRVTPPQPTARLLRHSHTSLLLTFLLLSASALYRQSPSLYQRSITSEAHPTLTASCIVSPGHPYPSPSASSLLSDTSARLAAQDDIILWSETALVVTNFTQEAALISHLQSLVRTSQSNVSHVGATFYNLELGLNMYILLAPDGSIAWRYQKTHPVPFTSDGHPGPGILPVYDSQELRLRLGGAICFDMDYPEFIRQAGAKKVDLFIQVSSTWGAVGHRHFAGNALRAVENGMTYFRCSSGGDSGVTTPYYDVLERRLTLFTGTTTYTVPVYPRATTPYVVVGWLLPYLCCVLSVGVWGLVLWWGCIRGKRPAAVESGLEEEQRLLAAEA